MQVRPVSKLKVVSVQHSKDKHPPKTFVLLDFDGKALPEVALKGAFQPESGDKTMAAFDDEDALLAWLDPRTGQCFHVWRHSLAQSVAALLAGVFCFYFFPDWDKFALWQQISFSLPLVGGAAWFLLAPGIRQKRVEKALQQKLNEAFSAKTAKK